MDGGGGSGSPKKESSQTARSIHHVNPGPELNKKSQKLDTILRNGLAGAVAGCTAKTVVAPLERIKILFQTSHSQFLQYSNHWNGLIHAARHIRTSYGVSALFKGHSASLIRVFPYAGINFLAFEQFRQAVITSPEKNTPLSHFFCGSMAGATSTAITYPLELIRIRLAFETVQKKFGSWFNISRAIYLGHGGNASLANFYQGSGPTMLGIIPYAGTSFLTHDLMRGWLRSPLFAPYTLEAEYSTRLTAVAQLACGAVAGIVAQTVSYPIEIVRRRMQVATVAGEASGIIATSRRVFLESGVRGFYRGLTIGYVKMAPMVATSFYVYDRMKRLLGLEE